MNIVAKIAVRAIAVLTSLPAVAGLPTVPASAAAPAGGSGLLQAGLGMLLVIGLIFGLAWAARRFGVQRLGGGALVKVLASAAVGTRERVVVIEVAGSWLVLGVTSTQVNALHCLPAQAAPDAGGNQPSQPAAKLLSLFAGKLREAVGAAGKP